MAESLAQLVDEIVIDAHDTDEQLSGFLQLFQDEVASRIAATVLDLDIDITGFDLERDERRDLVARCRRQEAADVVSPADVHFEPNWIAGWLHAAYRT